MKTKFYKADERGKADYGWLKAKYSFSFANYYDPHKIHFGALRVLNDDIIDPGMGFGKHPHDNMEIISVPLKGAMKHRDSMSNEWKMLKAGEVQVMSAGSGLMHSEMNGSTNESVHLFQIWIMSDKRNVAPRYDQKAFSKEDRKNKLQLLVNSIDEPANGALQIHQDAQISRIDLEAGKTLTYSPKANDKGVYTMLISGNVEIGDHKLEKRDALGIYDTDQFNLVANEDSEVLFIEVPMF